MLRRPAHVAGTCDTDHPITVLVAGNGKKVPAGVEGERVRSGHSPFLNPEAADADGLVGVGGDLSARLLLHAYRHGIFPYYDETTPLLWWSPDPRAIFELDHFHVSRRLARTVRSGKFAVTVNQDFAGVMAGCATEPRAPGSPRR